MANNKDLEEAAKRDRNKPGMGPKNTTSKPTISAPKKKVAIDSQWTQDALKKPVVKKAKGGMVRGWGCATKGQK